MIRSSVGGVIITLALIIAVPFAHAYTSPGKPTGLVNDFAGVLQPSERQALEAKLTNFKESSGDEVTVVTLKNLGGDTVENYASELFKEWGIGQKGKDNGILFLVAVDDHVMRIEVGYGFEGALTDAQSYWIEQSIAVPAFKNNNFYSGIDGVTNKIISAIQGEVIPSEDRNAPRRASGFNINIFFWASFALVWLASILGRSKSWWAGGVLGGVIGVVLGLFFGFLYTGVIALVALIPLGLLFDFLVSRAYSRGKTTGHYPWWIGGGRGFGGGGGGGFGGFGGGSSGGGGSSSHW